MKVGITGASGHVGANLIPLMGEKGYELRLLEHEIKVRTEGVNAEIVQGDVLDRNAMSEFVRGCDAVIHLAAKISIDGDPDGSVLKVNRDGTINVIEACIDEGVKRMIHFSTIHVYNPFPLDKELNESRELVGEHGTAYDQSKVAGEIAIMDAVEKRGFDAVVLTPTSVFGPRDYYPSLLGQAMVDIHNGKVPALIPGGYDFVPVGDVCKGTIAALEKGVKGEKYLLSGEFLTIKQLAKMVGDVTGKKTVQKVLPLWVLKSVLPIFKLQSKLSGQPPLFTKESLRAVTEANPFISSQKATIHFGFSKMPLKDAVKETMNWFGENGMLK